MQHILVGPDYFWSDSYNNFEKIIDWLLFLMVMALYTFDQTNIDERRVNLAQLTVLNVGQVIVFCHRRWVGAMVRVQCIQVLQFWTVQVGSSLHFD